MHHTAIIQVSVFDHDDDGDHDLIGSMETCLEELQILEETSSGKLLYKDEKMSGQILVTECKVDLMEETDRGVYPDRNGLENNDPDSEIENKNSRQCPYPSHVDIPQEEVDWRPDYS